MERGMKEDRGTGGIGCTGNMRNSMGAETEMNGNELLLSLNTWFLVTLKTY